MSTQPADAALQVALAYYRAWAGGDFETAMSYVAPDIRCQAPAGLVAGAEEFRDFMGPFVQIVRTTQLLAAYGQGDTALLMYGTETEPVADAPGAELHTVADGRIVRMRIIFDQLPFDRAQHGQPATTLRTSREGAS